MITAGLLCLVVGLTWQLWRVACVAFVLTFAAMLPAALGVTALVLVLAAMLFG